MKRKIYALALVLPLVFTISCSQSKQNQNKTPMSGIQSAVSEAGVIKNVKITAPNANVRTGCSNSAPIAQSANKDTNFNVISDVSGWYAVKLPENQIGFVSKDQVKPIVVDDKNTSIPESNMSSTPQVTSMPQGGMYGTGTSQGGMVGTGMPQDSGIYQGNSAPQNSGMYQGNSTAQGTVVPKTPSSKTNHNTLSAEEQQMITLVNQARSQNNVPALKVDMQVTNVARIKAQDMIDNNYFSHNSPKYGSPFDMMKAFGINYANAGENIAGNQDIANAQSALMNSPGHRKNILNPAYTHIGIGIKSGGSYGNMISQMFVSKPQ